MNPRFIMAILCLGIFLSACSTPDVPYTSLRPPTTAILSGNTVTLHLGSDMLNSAYWTRVKARVEGHTVYVTGRPTLFEQSREFTVGLPAMTGPPPVEVVWIDPDGRHVPVPIVR